MLHIPVWSEARCSGRPPLRCLPVLLWLPENVLRPREHKNVRRNEGKLLLELSIVSRDARILQPYRLFFQQPRRRKPNIFQSESSLFPPVPPISPTDRIGTINGNQNCLFILRNIVPNAVDRLSIPARSIYQTPWIWLVHWIVFDNLAIVYGMEYVVKIQFIILGFFVCMVGMMESEAAKDRLSTRQDNNACVLAHLPDRIGFSTGYLASGRSALLLVVGRDERLLAVLAGAVAVPPGGGAPPHRVRP